MSSGSEMGSGVCFVCVWVAVVAVVTGLAQVRRLFAAGLVEARVGAGLEAGEQNLLWEAI